jgi:Protein of unknown function (DUF3611)
MQARSTAPEVLAAASSDAPVVTPGAGVALRRLGWISFWSQLSLSTVSAVILSFAVQTTVVGDRTAWPPQHAISSRKTLPYPI